MRDEEKSKHTFERKKPEAFMQYSVIYVKCKDLQYLYNNNGDKHEVKM